MTTDLTKINGVGINSAKALREAGFDTIEVIAKSTPEALGKVSGFGPKRAARVIATAKELTQTAKKPAPVVAPAVATAHASHVANKGRGRSFFASAAVLVLVIVAVAYFGYQNGMFNQAPEATAQQDTASDTPEQVAMMPGQHPMYGPGTNGFAPMPPQGAMAPGQQQAMNDAGMSDAGMGEAGNADNQAMSAPPARQANEPEWAYRQRVQSDMQRARSDRFRAQAEKAQEASWNRYVASLPPAQAQQVVRQHDMAMKQMEASQRRQAAMIQQHNAYVKQRFGG